MVNSTAPLSGAKNGTASIKILDFPHSGREKKIINNCFIISLALSEIFIYYIVQ